MKKLFDSIYPFICVGMNKVSDSNLAIAVSKEGCIPTLSFYNFVHDSILDYAEANRELKNFYTKCPNANLIVSVSDKEFISEDFYSLYLKYRFNYIELIFENLKINGIEIDKSSYENIQYVIKCSERYKLKGTIFLLKALSRFVIIEFEKKFPKLFDAYILKSSDGAGRVVERKYKITIEEEIKLIKEINPNILIIPSGGIDFITAKRCLELDCPAIGFGTLFALSRESNIPLQTKNKLINSSIEKISNTHNGIIFSNIIHDDDENNTKSLVTGIKTSNQGIVYAGQGLKNIKEIKSVNQIILELVENIL